MGTAVPNHPCTTRCHFKYTSFVNLSRKFLLMQRTIMRSIRRRKKKNEKNRRNLKKKRDSMRQRRKRRKRTRRPGRGSPESLKKVLVTSHPSHPWIMPHMYI